jgi:hypothetical protein
VIRPEKIAAVLGMVVILLVVANIVVNVGKLAAGGDFYGVAPVFALNAEQNIPTFFAGCLLLMNAGLFGLTWRLFRQPGRPDLGWLGFAVLFVFLAFDELFQVHEKLITPIRDTLQTSGLLYFAWVLAYGLAVAVIAALFVPRWWRLDRSIRWWLAASSAVYLIGAVGFEMVGGAVYESSGRQGGVLYSILYTVEETLEMVGLVMLTYTLIRLAAGLTHSLQFDLAPPMPLRSTAVTRIGAESSPAWAPSRAAAEPPPAAAEPHPAPAHRPPAPLIQPPAPAHRPPAPLTQPPAPVQRPPAPGQRPPAPQRLDVYSDRSNTMLPRQTTDASAALGSANPARFAIGSTFDTTTSAE